MTSSTKDSSLLKNTGYFNPEQVHKAVETLRSKLLDLSFRNPLLNCRIESSRPPGIRLVNRHINEVYDAIINSKNNGNKTLSGFPDPPPPPEKAPNIQELAFEQNIDIGYDLDRSSLYKVTKKAPLQTLLYTSKLERLCQKLLDTQRTTEQELGFGTLHAAFGFLEWYETENSSNSLLSPLILVPVRLKRILQHHTYVYPIEAQDSDSFLPNVCLKEKLLRDFSITLPDTSRFSTPTGYVQECLAAIRHQKRWKIHSYVLIKHFSFSRIAMYLDLDASKWSKPPHTQTLVSNLLAGEGFSSKNAQPPDVYNVDSSEISKIVPYVVTELDSSQFSAVIDAAKGLSFALQGPPGTGKSQTITAMIAAALAQNKTVLFIAEKQAALQVVSKRLDQIGLSPFLLELHSTKANKRDILESFDKRLELSSSDSKRATKSLESIRDELDKTRIELKNYVEFLNSNVGNTDYTVHEIYWLEQSFRHKLNEPTINIEHLPIEEHAELVPQTAVERVASTFSCYADRRARVLKLSSVDTHPLQGIGKTGSFSVDIAELDNNLNYLIEHIAEIDNTLGEVEACVNKEIAGTPEELTELGAIFLKIPAPSSLVNFEILKSLSESHSTPELDDICKSLMRLKSSYSGVLRVTDKVENAIQNVEQIKLHHETVSKCTTSLDLNNGTLELLSQEVFATTGSLNDIHSILSICARLSEIIGITEPITLDSISLFSKIYEIIKDIPVNALCYRHAGLCYSDACSQLKALKLEADHLRNNISYINDTYSIDGIVQSTELIKHASNLESIGQVSYYLSSKGASLRRTNKQLLRGKGGPKLEVANICRNVAKVLDHKSNFCRRLQESPLVGNSIAQGLSTDFDALIAAAAFIEKTKASFPELLPGNKLIQKFLLDSDSIILDEVRVLLAPVASKMLQLTHSLKWRKYADLQHEIANRLTAANSLNTAINCLYSFDIYPTASLSAIELAVNDAIIIPKCLNSLKIASSWLFLTRIEDPHFADTNKKIIEETASYWSLVSSFSLPNYAINFLMQADYPASLAKLKHIGSILINVQKAVEPIVLTAMSRLELDLVKQFGTRFMSRVTLRAIQDKLSRAVRLADENKADWFNYLESFKQITTGFEALRLIVDAHNLDAHKASCLYQLAHFRSIITMLRRSNPTLTLKGDELSTYRKNLRTLDSKFMAISREILISKLNQRIPPDGISRGPVAERTELGLLRHEISKQTKNLATRKLLERAPDAALALKPCFMMSPASVSQYLPAISGWFDLVIIDEASQMPLEESLVVISRAKQAIIVGDQKQLPPNRIGQAVINNINIANDEEADNDALDVDEESVLDKALASMAHTRDLKWHYRSRHHSLIAFSNREFYNDKLIVFPSPSDNSSDLGISTEYVPDGRYADSKNVVEADKTLSILTSIIRKNPEYSIGVVAINSSQAELLNEKWDQLVANNDELAKYVAKWGSEIEELFIKNLENVQGDERDIIIISTVYGKDPTNERIAQRFGPISQKQGHRRLNVLFTRAKRKIVLVTSLTAEDIVISSESLPGKRALKGYLEFARSGRLESGIGEGDFESPFEREVAEVLKERGFTAASQVGVAGYRIDLAVRSAKNPDHFVLGIECDGATYHSAKSARDRDKLREDVLQGLGWDLYRIWSTDWFHTRDREIEKLIAAVESANKLWDQAIPPRLV